MFQEDSQKNQAVFSLKDKSEKLECRLLQFLFGALRFKINKLQYVFLWYPLSDHVRVTDEA